MLNIRKTSICLKKMQFYAYHGVLEQERIVGGEYTVDLILDISMPVKALLEDNIADTINYAEVYELVKAIMKDPVDLLERLAYKIVEKLFYTYQQIESIKIEVCKVNPPMGADIKGTSVALEVAKI
ncbi:MAG: dihydroneopterin aldolase [Bacteroidaceae bacterium]|nr:dihydroneopterin aldolase [Bacteroidaceae bacterium]